MLEGAESLKTLTPFIRHALLALMYGLLENWAADIHWPTHDIASGLSINEKFSPVL
jgi:hypothetical protein